MHRFTTRTRHRKRAIDTLFEAQERGFGDNPQKLRELAEQRQLLTAAQTVLPPYAVEVVNGVADHLVRIDTLIATYSRGWDIDRIAATDLAAMRVACWEMIANPEVDPRVAIDQAVTIVAAIGTDRSPSFVNAVLDKIRQVLATERRQQQRGMQSRTGNSASDSAAASSATGGTAADQSEAAAESSWELYRQQTQLLAAADSQPREDHLAAASEAPPEQDEQPVDSGAERFTEELPLTDDDATQPSSDSADDASEGTDQAEAAHQDEDAATTDATAPDHRLGIERHTIPDWLLADLRDDYTLPDESPETD